VAAGDDEGQEGKLVGQLSTVAGFQYDGMDVAFEVVDRDERFVEREGEGFGVEDADEQRAGQAGAFGDGDGVEVGEADVGFGDGLADDRDEVAQVLARGEFGNDPAVVGVECDLRGDHVRQDDRPMAQDGCGGFVATAFDSEDKAGPPGRWRRLHRLILGFRGFA
jgi:hypothetical protein